MGDRTWLGTIMESLLLSRPSAGDELASARYEFDVVHREFSARQREFDSVESSAGIVAWIAATLMAVYLSDPHTGRDRILEIALGCATWIATFGCMFFRGYVAFELIKFQRSYRDDPVGTLRACVDAMIERSSVNMRALQAKALCTWIGLCTIVAVVAVVSIARWQGP